MDALSGGSGLLFPFPVGERIGPDGVVYQVKPIDQIDPCRPYIAPWHIEKKNTHG